MTALPRTLARWEQELSWLPPTLVPALGAMLPTLSSAIGPLARSKRESGEPDGYGRISRRGPFDRLLTSQWALLDEVPEDFLRRASSQELLFFELARSEPHGSERSIALFDAGPFSLGAPRIAHLAIAIVLARRAADVGVPFYWSTLREPMLRPFVGEASVRQLLAAHTPFRATHETYDAWSELLTRATGAAAPSKKSTHEDDDLFVVGDGEAVANARRALGLRLAAITHEDGLASPRDSLELSIVRARQTRKRVVLPLPDEATRVRLLRDPFRTPEGAPQRPERPATVTGPAAWRTRVELAIDESAVAFSRDGRKVLARAPRGGLVGLALPEGDEPGRVMVRHAGAGSVVAAGSLGRRVVRVVRDAKGYLKLFELRGGSRDLDMVELRGRSSLGPPGELVALSIGVLSTPAEPLDLAVRTRMGLTLWSSVTAEPRVVAANAVVPIGSGANGFAVVTRGVVGVDASRWAPSGYVDVGAHPTDRDAVLARAPDDTLTVVRTGRSTEGPIERAQALLLRPGSPHFLPVIEVLEHGEHAAIVTEHVESPTLGTLIARMRAGRHRMPIGVAASIVHQAAEIVQTLAEHGHPPHGLLRPDAIHLSSDGRVRISHWLEWPLGPSDPEAPGGQYGYIAPEQLTVAENDARTDVYSLGLVLHELLGGVHPTGKTGTMDRIQASQAGALFDLAALVPNLPPELHAIVRTATSRDPAARFQSVHALAEALARFLAMVRTPRLLEDRIAVLSLDDEPTTRRQLLTPWDVTLLRSGRHEGGRERIAPALRVVVGGTAGGNGLFGFVESDRVRILSPARVGAERVVAFAPGAEVVGVCGYDECVIRRGDALEIRDANGTVASFPAPHSARVTMAPGWPHLAIRTQGGALRVISLALRREVLVAGADA